MSKKLILGVSAEGSVNLLRGQAEFFSKKGYDVFLIAPGSERVREFCNKERCKHLKVPLKREISPISDLINLFRLIYIIKRIKPDIVNFGTPKISMLGLIAAYLARVPRIFYTCRGFRFETETGLKRILLRSIERMNGYFADKIIFISPSLMNAALEMGLFNSGKAIVINKGSSNGVDLDRFNPERIDSLKKNAFIEENDLKGKFIYGFIGRLVRDKGLKELLEAFFILKAKYVNVELILIGSQITASSEDIALLESYTNKYNLRLLGYQENIPLILSAIDVLVLPTYREGFGNVFLQAAAMGTPVIGTNVTGAISAVKDNFNGIIIPPFSSEAVMNAMEKLFLDSNLKMRFSANGPKWAKEFDQKIIWKGLEELYKK